MFSDEGSTQACLMKKEPSAHVACPAPPNMEAWLYSISVHIGVETDKTGTPIVATKPVWLEAALTMSGSFPFIL